jgi:tetratricopeptide (TPR) repeat protein
MSDHITGVQPVPAPENPMSTPAPDVPVPAGPRGHSGGSQKLVIIVLLLVLFGAIGLGVYSGVRHLKAWNHYRDGEQALKRNDLNAAREHLEACLAVWPKNATVHFLAGRTYRRLGDFDQANDHLNTCQQLGYDAEAVKLERSLMAVQRGDLGSAEKKLLEDVANDHPDSVLILEALVDGYLHSHSRMAPALHCLNLWLEREPENVRALVLRGLAREWFHDQDGALKDFQHALELDQNNLEARLRLAEALLAIPRPAEALEQFDLMPEEQRRDPQVMFGLARCHKELGHADEAIRILDALLQKDGDNEMALRERGQLAFNRKNLSLAHSFLQRAVDLDPFDKMANYYLFQCLESLGKQRGREFALCAPWVLLYSAWTQLEARIYQNRYERIDKDEQRLQEIMAQLMEKGSHDPAVYAEGGMIYLRLGQPAEARDWFGTALHLDPQHDVARKGLRECDRELQLP